MVAAAGALKCVRNVEGGGTSEVEHTLWLDALGVQLLRAGYAATMEPNCALAYGTNFKPHGPQFGLI